MIRALARTISSLRPLWSALLGALYAIIVYSVVAVAVPALPFPSSSAAIGIGIVAAIVVLILLIAVAPRAEAREPVEVTAPVTGTWAALNTPGQQLPSHGTRMRGQYSAVDIMRPADEHAPPLSARGIAGSRPEDYACFGAPVLSMAAGTVVRVRQGQRDHRARNTWPALVWMMTGEGILRELGGTRKVLGNHIVVAHDDGTFAAYAHLRRSSAEVAEGRRVEAGQELARVGNTGNSSMPHLHVQLMDRARVDAAAGLPMRWANIEPHDELDAQLGRYAKPAAATAVAGMPRNAQVFTIRTDSGVRTFPA